VPVYGAADDLGRCLASIAAHTSLGEHRVLVVADGPQDEAVERHVGLFKESQGQAVTVLRNERRLGFVHTVNRGMEASARDVVLLNADTIVTPRWLEKLTAAAYSRDSIGTVTPLSNYATLVSVPRAFEENLLPAGYDAAAFAAVVERVSARAYVRIPTGVGVCMYIKRALLDVIGLFDAERFGLGYGEENDFCLRALDRGWVHIADDATFIYHAGHRSFGASRAALQRVAARRLAEVHPTYEATIARFMREDPLAPVRERIVAALRPARRATRSPARVVHVVHGWPPREHAGTELYASWLVREQLQWRDVSVYTRLSDPARRDGDAVEETDGGARVRLVTNNFRQRNPLSRNALRDGELDADFARFLRQERPGLVHIHHLAGHAFSLARVARRLRIPIVQHVQDWWPLCARVNLLDSEWRRCTGPGLAKCARCAPLTRVAPRPLWNRALHVYRRVAARSALAAADAYVMGSYAIRNDYRSARLFSPRKPQFVLPYGVPGTPGPPRPNATRPIRFGMVGALLPHKGTHLAVDAFHAIDREQARLRLWGSASSPGYLESLRQRAGAAVAFEGIFAEEDRASVYAGIDVLLVPSTGLESFGLAAREAMLHGVPVVATADGALPEMFEAGVSGDYFPNGDTAALRAIIQRLIAEPSIVDAWRARLPRPKSVAEHALEIEAVYETVLAARP